MSRNNRFSASIDSASPTNAGGCYAEMIAGASKSIVVESITITSKTNVGGTVALSRSYAVGTGSAAGIATGVSHRVGTAMGRLQSAWSQAPTGFGSKLRGEILPVATGSTRQLWSSDVDGPLVIEPGASLLLVNGGSGIDGGSFKISASWEESA